MLNVRSTSLNAHSTSLNTHSTSLNRVDVGDYSPSTSHCTVRTGLVYGATYI